MLPSQPISHGAVSTSSTASIHNVGCLWRIMCITYIATQACEATISTDYNFIGRLTPKRKSLRVILCGVVGYFNSAIECTCIEMILSCPGKGYRVGSPIVAPNYVKLQMAIKKKHYMQWKSYDCIKLVRSVPQSIHAANQHSFIHTLYQCTVPPPHALQGFWSSCIAIKSSGNSGTWDLQPQLHNSASRSY